MGEMDEQLWVRLEGLAEGELAVKEVVKRAARHELEHQTRRRLQARAQELNQRRTSQLLKYLWQMKMKRSEIIVPVEELMSLQRTVSSRSNACSVRSALSVSTIRLMATAGSNVKEMDQVTMMNTITRMQAKEKGYGVPCIGHEVLTPERLCLKGADDVGVRK